MSAVASSHAVRHDEVGFAAFNINSANNESATGILLEYDCWNGSTDVEVECTDVNGGICLMALRGTASIQDLLQNCEDGNGIGAVIYPFTGGGRAHENWVVNNANIPAVAVTWTAGRQLASDYLGQSVTIGDAEGDGIEYFYETVSGTSIATPQVTVAAALVWSHFGSAGVRTTRFVTPWLEQPRKLPTRLKVPVLINMDTGSSTQERRTNIYLTTTA
jgi:hypothetical protein